MFVAANQDADTTEGATSFYAVRTWRNRDSIGIGEPMAEWPTVFSLQFDTNTISTIR